MLNLNREHNSNNLVNSPKLANKRALNDIDTNIPKRGRGRPAKIKKANFFDKENLPTYCSCDQPEYGEMIACESGKCKIEWFHFSCVGLNKSPLGKWICKDCNM